MGINDIDGRASVVKIGGVDYPLVVTTRATKEIAKRYGGLESLGERLLKAENFEEALGEVVWLIVLLANQAIMIHNLQNRGNQKGQKPLLTEDDVELMTTPSDMLSFKAAITDAMLKGTKRNVESEESDDKKNQQGA